MRTLLLSVLVALAASAAHAQGLVYAQFETSVNHIDLETCPAQVKAEGVFCRATILHDALHVYVFEQGGDLAFVEMLTFEDGDFEIDFK